MKIKKVLTNNRLLVRLIVSYLVTSILFTVILMAVVSGFVSSRTKEKTTETAYEIMRQSYNTAYYALTNIYADFHVLWSRNTSIKRTLEDNDVSKKDIEISSNIIDSIAFRDDLVDSVYIINKKSNLAISNIQTPEPIDKFYDQSSVELLSDFEKYYDRYKDEVFFPRNTSYTLYGKGYEEDYISIVYAEKKDDKIDSGIIVNIDQNKLSKLINTGNGKGSMIITNSSGRIISDSEGTSFGRRLASKEIYDSIANNSNDEDSFIGNYLGDKSFITYKKAENLGFIFISIIPYSSIVEETSKIDRVIAIFFMIAMFINLIVSIISIKRIYEPLNDLIKDMKNDPSIENGVSMDEYDFLGETYSNLILKNKRSNAARIFKGNYNDSAIDILGFSKDKFLTLSIMIDHDESDSLDNLEKVMDIVDTHTNWAGAITSSSCISCILNENKFDDNKMDDIMEGLVSLQDVISEELDNTVSIGLGTVVNSLESIKFSQRYATLAVKYALSIGENQVILYTEIENNSIAASQNRDSVAEKIAVYVLNNFYRQDFSADEVAKEVDLSLGYARQIFRKEKGLTLNDFIIGCRIDKAKELLINTEDTAKDISEAVGYYDNRYFYTLFKKKVGMTTEEFRNMEGSK